MRALAGSPGWLAIGWQSSRRVEGRAGVALSVVDVRVRSLCSLALYGAAGGALLAAGAGGTYCAPLPVASITDAAGNAVPVTPDCHPVLAPDVAAAATDAARCPVGQQSA